MQVLDALVESSEATVEAGSFDWRIRAVDSAAISRTGVSLLLLAPPGGTIEQAIRPMQEGESEMEAARRVALVLGPDRVAERERISMALVAAGLVAVREPARGDAPASEWEPVRAVLAEAEEARGASPARLWIGRLPVPVIETLAGAIQSLSLDGGRAAARLAAFRGF